MKFQKIIRDFPDYHQSRFSFFWGALGFFVVSLIVEALLFGIAYCISLFSSPFSLFR